MGAVSNISDGQTWGIWVVYDVMIGSALACGGYVMAMLVHTLREPLVESVLRTAEVYPREGDDRLAYVRQACAGNSELRRRVEELLAHADVLPAALTSRRLAMESAIIVAIAFSCQV